MRYILVAAFGSAFVASVLLVLLVRRVATRAGFVDRPGGRKQHARPVALGGGIAIMAAAWLPLVAAAFLSHAWVQGWTEGVGVPEDLHSAVRGAASRLPVVLGVLAAGLGIFAFGLWDDLRPFSPRLKLVGQFIIVGLLAVFVKDIRITIYIAQPAVNVAVTTVWFVLLINSFNLLDNMDGQSGMVASLTGAALLVLSLQTGQYFVGGMLLALLGALLGFLVFNLPPASVFMGDAGSMSVGYMLAVATSLCTFVTGTSDSRIFPIIVPLIVFAVPLYDSLSVVTIRFRQGRPLLAGDRNHFSHRLMRLGMSERMVLVTVGLTVVATAAGATVPYGGTIWRALTPVVQALAVLLVIVQLELVSGRNAGGDGGQ